MELDVVWLVCPPFTRKTGRSDFVKLAAIAANLASGMNMHDAVKSASRYVEAGIKTATDLGRGSGPINHFHSTYKLPFAP